VSRLINLTQLSYYTLHIWIHWQYWRICFVYTNWLNFFLLDPITFSLHNMVTLDLICERCSIKVIINHFTCISCELYNEKCMMTCFDFFKNNIPEFFSGIGVKVIWYWMWWVGFLCAYSWWSECYVGSPFF